MNPSAIKRSLLLGASLFACCPLVWGQVRLDQQQPGTESGAGVGPSEQKLAQTFRAGRSGELTHVMLPIACDGTDRHTLTVSLQTVTGAGLPSGVVLAAIDVNSSVMPTRPERRFSAFPLEAAIAENQRYAIVIASNPEAECDLFGTREERNYPDGEPFFDARPNPPGWRPATNVADFAFQTYVDSRRDACDFRTAYGADNEWVPADVPVCGCLRDESLANERCWFRLPELVLVREIPRWPKEDFVIRWSVLPLVDEPLPLQIELHSRSGKLVGDPLKLDAGKPLHASPVSELYWADNPAALDATRVIVRNALGTIEFDTQHDAFEK